MITKSCIINNVHDIFINIYLDYAKILEASIEDLKKENILQNKPLLFYNYLICDAKLLYKLLEKFDTHSLLIKDISCQDMIEFKNAIIYVGKGVNDRKSSHLFQGLELFEGKMELNKINAKYSKITSVWRKGNGIVLLQVYSDSDHYVSLCRENAMIKAVGKNLTNLINGSVYGLMKSK